MNHSLSRFLPVWVAALAVSALGATEPANLITTPSGLRYLITEHGTGALAKAGEVIIYHYKGTLPDGTVFDSSFDRKTPFAFTLGRKQVIKGVEEAFGYFGVGAKGTMIIPPDLAYGAKQRGAIPPNSTLRFDIEVLEIKAHGLADLLQETIDTAGLAAAQAKFAEVQAAKFDGLYVSESQLNNLGYKYLTKGDNLPAALAVLQWNVELYPASGNVYDSLGEANVKNDDRAAALRNYAKALELDPKNQNAEKFLTALKATADEPGALVQMLAHLRADEANQAH
ncbi:MAG: FKBP-type peptidyl-prolyl cis-trans isomerase [Lacunisphaera sp.]|nr:FKBP-type peptidyl-prolyl cis-trans isomerase [Lacunisphaera sp.]